MMQIIGNIKIESYKRLRYMVASVISMSGPPIWINVETGPSMQRVIRKSIRMASPFALITFDNIPYRNMMFKLIDGCQYKYLLNFEEDHFMNIDLRLLDPLMRMAEKFNVDVIRASFNEIEQNSAEGVECIHEDGICKIFRMNPGNFNKFQKHYKKRYFLGTNCVFKQEFALRFYDRAGNRPHDYELAEYDERFEHICMVPKIKMLSSIDDDHGEPNTCLESTPTVKFKQCMENANEIIKMYK